MALIAMVATGGGQERTRSWLQDRIWGSRQPAQARASLRRELSNLRKAIGPAGGGVLNADYSRVWFTEDRVAVGATGGGEFLEGLDIVGEDAFEDWLRSMRMAAQAGPATGGPSSGAPGGAPATFEQAEVRGRPSLAVLPFTNASGDADNQYLAEGISEDLIDRLSRLRWLPIIARSSSFRYADGSADAKTIGAALGVRYLLEGRIRRQTGGLGLAASLTDATTGFVIWTTTLTIAAGFDPAAIEQLAKGLVGALDARIDIEEQQRALRRSASDAHVGDLIWRGRWHFNRFTREDALAAHECFEKALAIEPQSSEALIQYTWSTLWDLWARRRSDTEIRQIRDLAKRAIVADPHDGRGYMLAGIVEMWLKHTLRAETLIRKAIALNPSLVLAYAELGSTYYLANRPAEAIVALEAAIPLSPADNQLFYILGELAMSHYMLGNWDRAIDHADRSLALRAGYWLAHVVKINALVESGRSAEAPRALAELNSSHNGFDVSHCDWIPFVDAAWNSRLKQGLRRSVN